MYTSITLSIALCLSLSLAQQMPNYFQAGIPSRPMSTGWPSGPPTANWMRSSLSAPSGWQSAPSSWPPSAPLSSPWSSGSPASWSRAAIPSPSSSPFSQYQPYRAPSAVASPTFPRSQATLSTLSQFSGYNRLSASSQPSPWGQPPTVNRMPAFTQSSGAYAGFPRSPGSQFAPIASQAPVAQPQAQFQSSPFQMSWNINHDTRQSAAPVASPQPQSYSPPSPQQSYVPPSPPASLPAPQQSWSAPPAQPWSPPPATQTYSAPAPAPQQAPQTFTSTQNAQNYRPAPVHYANIGAQLQGDYKFGYHTGDGGSFREETRLPDGTVQGAYGFIDADGKQRIVKYKAGKDGFQAEGDDVPKGTPVSGGAPDAQPTQPAAPINFDEGAAYKSFTQG